jgi:hypothetical protein
LVLCYLGLYALGRFLLELIRTDTTFRLWGLSRNGWVSLGVVVGASVWLVLRERHHPTPEPALAGAEGTDDTGVLDEADGPEGPDGEREPATVSAGRVQTAGAADAGPAEAAPPDTGGGDSPPAATGPSTAQPPARDSAKAAEAGAVNNEGGPEPSPPSEEPARDRSSADGNAS